MQSKIQSTEPTGPLDSMERISWDDLDKRKYYVIGPSTFVLVRALVYPSTLVKTRLQIQSRTRPLYNGTWDAFRTIVRTEGIAGLYKGFGANLLNVVTGNMYITMYELGHKFYMENVTSKASTANFLAGATASILNQTIIVPLDIVSQRMMIAGQNAPHHKGPPQQVITSKGILSISKDIFRKEGLRGFYRGYLPSVATYAPSSSLWWGSYGVFWPKYFTLLPTDMDPFYKQVMAQALGGGSAGVLTAVVTNPMDVVRTRTQIYTEYGAIETMKYLFKRDGFQGFMTGVNARVLAMGPSGVLIISAYELVKRLSRKIE